MSKDYEELCPKCRLIPNRKICIEGYYYICPNCRSVVGFFRNSKAALIYWNRWAREMTKRRAKGLPIPDQTMRKDEIKLP